MLNTADTVLHISHVTHYDYASRVDLAMHLLHLQPLSRADQQLEDFRLDIDPPATRNQASLDYFGNPQHHLTLTTPHHALTVRAESRVRRLAATYIDRKINDNLTRTLIDINKDTTLSRSMRESMREAIASGTGLFRDRSPALAY